VVRETLEVSKISVAVVEGDSDICEYARQTVRAIATCLVTDVRDVTPTRLITNFTHIFLGHSSRKVVNHVIMASASSYNMLSLLEESTRPSNIISSQLTP